jgi:F420H(2)-dependent quinone reductase
MDASPVRRPPRWLKYVNRINVALLRRGVGPGPQRLLSVPGRATGQRRTTPVAVVSIAGERYVVAGYQTSDWVKNARAAGWGVIGRGKTNERVTLTEMPIEATPSILREFARKVPGSRAFLTVAASASDADFAEASTRHPVFRLN